MTDNIKPDWISDHLPTKEDGDIHGLVFVSSDFGNYLASNVHYSTISTGENWARIPEGFKFKGNWWENIATPKECLDEKEALDKRQKVYKPDTSELHAKLVNRLKITNYVNFSIRELKLMNKLIDSHHDRVVKGYNMETTRLLDELNKKD